MVETGAATSDFIPPIQRRHWRRKMVVFVLLGLSCWLLYRWILLPVPIRISQETTWLTGPLTADREYVDYSRAMEQMFPAMRDAWEQSPWYQLAYSDAPRASGVLFADPERILQMESATDLHHYLNLRSTYPFSAEEDPALAEIIARNEAWYTLAMATDPGPALMPSHDGLYSLQVGGGPNDKFIRRFALRTMLAFGEGDTEKGWQGLSFQMAVQQHTQQLPGLLGARLAFDQQERINRQLWSIALKHPELKGQMLDLIAEFPAPDTLVADMVKRFDGFERLIALNEIQNVHRNTSTMLLAPFFPREQENATIEWARVRELWKRIEFNELMKAQNVSIDEMKEILQLADVSERHQRLNSVFEALEKDRETSDETSLSFALLGNPSRTIASRMRYNDASCCSAALKLMLSATNHIRLCHLAVELATFKQTNARYPASFAELLETQHVETSLSNICLDAFTGQEFHYQSDGETVLIHSLGANGVDDTNVKDENIASYFNDDVVWLSRSEPQ